MELETKKPTRSSLFGRRVCNRGCVCTKGIVFLLLWNTVIHSCGYFLLFSFFFGINTGRGSDRSYGPNDLLLVISIAECISYIFYPVAGLVGGVCWSKYKMMVAGTILSFSGLILGTSFLVLVTFKDCTETGCSIDISTYAMALVSAGMFIYLFGLGMFEANAIQFGVDQLQFASNEKLRIFINWYFWHCYISKMINIGVAIAIQFFHFRLIGKIAFVVPAFLIGIVLVSSFIYCFATSQIHDYLHIEPLAGHSNPVTHIYRVLKFVLKHNKPVCRSAFTYGETPSRMDYAKERFGGIFTTDQVEDVKAFCRILILLLTLFGLAFQSDSSGYFSLFCIQYIVIGVWVPIHMLVIRPCCVKSTNESRRTIFPKIQLGLLLTVAYNLIMLINNFKFWNPFEPLAAILYGCSLVLVFLSTLEFILAQAPRSMQGLLIGLWYAYQSLSVVFYFISWYITFYKRQRYLYAVSTLLSILSLLLFQCVSSWYKYRQRNEYTDVNRQLIIEQYTERQLLRGQLQEQPCDEEYFSITIETVQQ